MKNKNRKYGKDYWMFKAPLELKKTLDLVRLERIKRGKDKEVQSYNRLGKAISRIDNLPKLLINADFVMEEEKNE